MVEDEDDQTHLREPVIVMRWAITDEGASFASAAPSLNNSRANIGLLSPSCLPLTGQAFLTEVRSLVRANVYRLTW